MSYSGSYSQSTKKRMEMVMDQNKYLNNKIKLLSTKIDSQEKLIKNFEVKIKSMEVKIIQLEKIINSLPNNNSSSFNFDTNQKSPPVNPSLLNAYNQDEYSKKFILVTNQEFELFRYA
jgi:septal ring factor EnvC (AmiA/AmiB activator)